MQNVVIRYETNGSIPKIVTSIISNRDEALEKCKELWKKECLTRGRREKDNDDFERAYFVRGVGTIMAFPPGEANNYDIKFAVITIP